MSIASAKNNVSGAEAVNRSTTSQSCAEQIRRLLVDRILPRLPEISRCHSTPELEEHPIYREIDSDVRSVLECIESEDYRDAEAPTRSSYRVIAWNIERGIQLEAQMDALRNHPYLKDFDVLLLTEVDIGMARSGNRDVAQDLARGLRLAYAFVPCYLNLTKGSGLEYHIEEENTLGLQGNAILSRHELSDIRRLPLKNGIDKMSRREKRLGSLNVLLARIGLPGLPLDAAAVHLDAQSTQEHRCCQMKEILAALPGSNPALLGGDWNTSTHNSSTSFHAIMGYWLRVIMGVDHVIRNHYLHPYRRFEKRLFGALEEKGWDFRTCNNLGERTAVYDMIGPKAHLNLREWLPGWCFPFIRWALRHHGGVCPLKLDWFAARGLTCRQPRVLHDLTNPAGEELSDHDPIGIDIEITR